MDLEISPSTFMLLASAQLPALCPRIISNELHLVMGYCMVSSALKQLLTFSPWSMHPAVYFLTVKEFATLNVFESQPSCEHFSKLMIHKLL